MHISSSAQVIIIMAALALVGLVVIAVSVARLYRKTTPSMAMVITGNNRNKPAKVIIDGGAVVIPVLQSTRLVTLEVIQAKVERRGNLSLLTMDRLRVDIDAEFYVNISKETEMVARAAAKIGEGSNNPDTIRTKLDGIFESALRQVTGTMNVDDLLIKRPEFIANVKTVLLEVLADYGMQLNDVVIKRLDYTPRADLDIDNNPWDAEGNRKIVERTAQQQVAANSAKLTADRQIEEDKVSTQQFLNQQAIQLAENNAQRELQERNIQAETQQKAATLAAEQALISQRANIKTEEGVAVAQAQREQAELVAQQDRDKAVQTATIDREKTIEVAVRDKAIAVAAKNTEHEQAEAKRLTAEAEKQAAAEQVNLVQVEAAANRDKITQVVRAEAEAQRRQIDENTKVDVEAYAIQRTATAEQEAANLRAEAKTIEAKANADAKTIEAEAEANAIIRRAEGERAVQMVPVEVEARRVEIKASEVEVERNKLEAQTQYESISRGLQVDLANISADRDVRVAQAEAMGAALGQANITMWGTADQLNKVSEAFMGGQAVASSLKGFTSALPPALVDTLANAFAKLAEDQGVSINPDDIKNTIAGFGDSPVSQA